MVGILGKLFDSNEKQLKKYAVLVSNINAFEPEFEKYSDHQIKETTQKWIGELAKKNQEEQEKHLNTILPEAFALVREAAKRAIGQRHFDAQLMAGLALHEGKIAEQKTGEGKTLTATLPMYLNALTGSGTHLVTPNDYLARHGAGWMGLIYNKLGLSVGVIMQERAFIYDPEYESHEFEDAYSVHLKETPRVEAYKCHVTYGTNHEFGFDYLRDNMVHRLEDMVQTNPNGKWGVHNFSIVDEVDSILIDVARTPLIISTKDAKPSERYQEANRIVKSLVKGTDYEVEEKYRNATLTDLGVRRVERLVGAKNLYEEDFEMVHLIEQALSANALFVKDKDYIVKEGKVVIIDQNTGRMLPSNRYSHGLHQAIEAKEGVEIQEESKTMGEISYQNYFRKYKKLAGMTGTAATEAEEFYKIYKLDVVVVPTNKPVVRKDHNDVVYKTESAKFKAVADEIEEKHNKGQPVLVGTTSVEKSELLHEFLTRRRVSHEILNAKNHEREALIIAQAGKKGAVTISTNMAGRGVDIILGGDPPNEQEQKEVISAGGLHVIGTERHESRRIDNQLRGRSGRQGDPGSSRFFVSLQDDLMRIFGGDQVKSLMDRFGLEENVPLEAGLVTRSIESAQKRVEGMNFDARKRTVEIDDVMNVHRETIYTLRRRILELGSGDETNKHWFIEKLDQNSSFGSNDWESKESKYKEIWGKIVLAAGLPIVDVMWMEHLVDMDQIEQGIGLRGYAQRDPIVEYKKEGHERFGILVSRVYATIGERLSKVTGEVVETADSQNEVKTDDFDYKHGEFESGVSNESAMFSQGRDTAETSPRVVDQTGRQIKVQKIVSGKAKVGRNDPCPCGSGKKFKHCHGK